MSKFGKSLKKRRKRLKLSQRRLADRVGISAPMISRYERGVRLKEMGLSHAVKLSTFLSWPIKDMLKVLAREE